MKKIFLILMVLVSVKISAQNGTIRGTVLDDADNQTIIGANANIKSLYTGASTDLDGKFSISIAPGTYTLEVSFISYQKVVLTEVIVKAGEVTNLGTIRLKSATIEVGEVVVQATASRKNEAAMNRIKSSSVAMMDGISSEKLALTGDGNAAEAAKRVTGVSIEGGKYIYVRGLGDRYSKVTLNQMDIPGLDPDKNSLQMDIFPSNLIDNILVSKNFTADMPADFAGGILNVETKAFPEEKIMNVSVGASFNPAMHFNSNHLSYDGSSTDFLGFDDGQRDIPVSAANPEPSEFDPTLASSRNTSLMNYSLGFSMGNQIDLKNRKDSTKLTGNKFGYVFSASYKTDYTYYDDVEFNEYQKSAESDEFQMIEGVTQKGEIGEQSVLIGLMGGLAYKTEKSKYRLSLLRLQNGTSRAGKFSLENSDENTIQTGFSATSDNLEYNQRSLTNLLLNGKHVIANNKWELDWRISPTLSTSEDPDIRKTAFTVRERGGFELSAGDGGMPSRIWRDLQEVTLTGKADLTREYKIKERNAKLKFGTSYTLKSRDYEILNYDIQAALPNRQRWESNDADQILDPSNLVDSSPNNISYIAGTGEINSNAYESSIQNIGLYISNEFSLKDNLKAIVGLRAEQYTQRHTGRDIDAANGLGGNELNDEKVLESLDLFPSVNVIYNLKEEQNLRFAYARTIARPSFKELSFAQIVDPLTNRIFNGSLFQYDDWDGNIVQTNIDNIDLRWEKFMERGQILSASLFFKNFQNPIELVRIPEAVTTSEFQPRNVGNGRVLGIELEATKGLDFITEDLENFSVSGNLTLVHSRVDMTDREFNARKIFEKDGEDIKRYRQMAGQAPYVVNFGVSYKNVENGISAGIFYNVKGPALEIVGSGRVGDIYQEPFHSLNLGLNKKLGEEGRTVIDFKVDNMLNDRRESYYRSYKSDDQIFSSLNPGITISAGISHKF